jgi:hypothetical protein
LLYGRTMISAVIEAREGEEEQLARTLASLIGAAVDGALREAIVVSAGPPGGIARVADHAGCGMAESLAEAIRTARGDWLLLLEPGARLLGGWSDAALAHAAGAGGPARLSLDASVRVSLLRRLRSGPLWRGLFISRREAAALTAGGLGGLRLRLSTLPARLMPAA